MQKLNVLIAGSTGYIGVQLVNQGVSVVATLAYSGIGSYVILKLLDKLIGLRVSEDVESEGLDLTLHDERGYNI